MAVTRISDVAIPGGIAPSNDTPKPLTAPAAPPSQYDLLRTAMAISDRLAAERGPA